MMMGDAGRDPGDGARASSRRPSSRRSARTRARLRASPAFPAPPRLGGPGRDRRRAAAAAGSIAEDAQQRWEVMIRALLEDPDGCVCGAGGWQDEDGEEGDIDPGHAMSSGGC